MGKKLIRLTESDLHRIIKESIYRIITEIDTNRHSIVLYHKSPISCRMSILKKGLLPSVGDSYKAHWDDKEDLTPYIFLYDHNTINGGEYDSTYDDDIYAIDVSQLDKEHLFNDPDGSMNGCFAYDIPIPTSAIKLVYKGTEGDSDERLMAKHSHIYESIIIMVSIRSMQFLTVGLTTALLLSASPLTRSVTPYSQWFALTLEEPKTCSSATFIFTGTVIKPESYN